MGLEVVMVTAAIMAVAATDTDTLVLRARLVGAMVPPQGSADASQLQQAAAELSGSLGANGRWPDVNYNTVGAKGRSWWETGTHLQRAIILATAARYERSPALASKAELALQCWCANDFQNSNWWWSWIGTPRAVAKVLLLLPDSVAADMLPLALPILNRSNYSHPGNPNEATNLVWMSGTRVLVGCLTGNATEVTEAYREMSSTTELDTFGEGLQSDGSYWQHGPQLYSGWGYGAIWTGQMLFFGSMAADTPWEFPAIATNRVGKMIVDGQRWMTAGASAAMSTPTGSDRRSWSSMRPLPARLAVPSHPCRP